MIKLLQALLSSIPEFQFEHDNLLALNQLKMNEQFKMEQSLSYIGVKKDLKFDIDKIKSVHFQLMDNKHFSCANESVLFHPECFEGITKKYLSSIKVQLDLPSFNLQDSLANAPIH